MVSESDEYRIPSGGTCEVLLLVLMRGVRPVRGFLLTRDADKTENGYVPSEPPCALRVLVFPANANLYTRPRRLDVFGRRHVRGLGQLWQLLQSTRVPPVAPLWWPNVKTSPLVKSLNFPKSVLTQLVRYWASGDEALLGRALVLYRQATPVLPPVSVLLRDATGVEWREEPGVYRMGESDERANWLTCSMDDLFAPGMARLISRRLVRMHGGRVWINAECLFRARGVAVPYPGKEATCSMGEWLIMLYLKSTASHPRVQAYMSSVRKRGPQDETDRFVATVVEAAERKKMRIAASGDATLASCPPCVRFDRQWNEAYRYHVAEALVAAARLTNAGPDVGVAARATAAAIAARIRLMKDSKAEHRADSFVAKVEYSLKKRAPIDARPCRARVGSGENGLLCAHAIPGDSGQATRCGASRVGTVPADVTVGLMWATELRPDREGGPDREVAMDADER